MDSDPSKMSGIAQAHEEVRHMKRLREREGEERTLGLLGMFSDVYHLRSLMFFKLHLNCLHPQLLSPQVTIMFMDIVGESVLRPLTQIYLHTLVIHRLICLILSSFSLCFSRSRPSLLLSLRLHQHVPPPPSLCVHTSSHCCPCPQASPACPRRSAQARSWPSSTSE